MNTNLNNLKSELLDFANSSPMREVCGFVCEKNGEFFLAKARNKANQDDLFLISAVDFLERKMSGELVAIFHTHIDCDEKLSDFDVQNSKNCLYPFLVYSLETEKFSLFDMDHFDRAEKSVIELKGILDD